MVDTVEELTLTTERLKALGELKVLSRQVENLDPFVTTAVPSPRVFC